MAATKKPIEAFNAAKAILGNVTLEKVKYNILDAAIKMIWTGAPWRWSIGSLPVISLEADKTDYTVTFPYDFLYIHRAYVTDERGTPRELRVASALPGNASFYGLPSEIAVSDGKIRIYPKPAGVSEGNSLIVQYKKQAPVIDAVSAEQPGALVIDDEWFWVYESAVLYFAFVYSDDPRAGSAQADVATGRAAFTGQRGIFEANLAMMRQREPLVHPLVIQTVQEMSRR